jgi:protein SFI1
VIILTASLSRAALQKWQACRRQHFEEASLLENYLLVKKEGNDGFLCNAQCLTSIDVIRRAFHKWLTAKRAAEHRRLTHQRKEAHLRQVAIISAWEKWRERFKEERLRPLVGFWSFSHLALSIHFLLVGIPGHF